MDWLNSCRLNQHTNYFLSLSNDNILNLSDSNLNIQHTDEKNKILNEIKKLKNRPRILENLAKVS